jgi:hypothetical protein
VIKDDKNRTIAIIKRVRVKLKNPPKERDCVILILRYNIATAKALLRILRGLS